MGCGLVCEVLEEAGENKKMESLHKTTAVGAKIGSSPATEDIRRNTTTYRISVPS